MNYANALGDLGSYEKVEKFYLEILQQRTSQYWAVNIDTMRALEGLAVTYSL